MEDKIADLQAKIGAARFAVMEARVEERSKHAGDVQPLKELQAQLKPLWIERKAAKKEVLALPAVKEHLAQIEEARKNNFKDARAKSGVYWGTYIDVEGAVLQARKGPTPPRYQPWTGEGSVGTQLIHGLPADAVMAGTDTRLRISSAPTPVPGRGGKPLPRLFVRVGSNGRDPIFGEWPIILHRPLPVGAIVKWVKVVRRRVAAHEHWSAHLTLEIPEAPKSPGTDRALAVNLRWSAKGDVTTTAADYFDGTEERLLKVDQSIGSALKKSDDLRSIRDRQFEEVKPLLKKVRALSGISDEFKRRIETAHVWRSQGKLAAVIIWWRNNRVPGDEQWFAKLEDWRKQDKHLWDWEANARRKAIARRRDAYRVFAAQSARGFDVLILEKLNLSKLAVVPAPGEDREYNAQANAQRVATAPSELRSALLNAFKRAGKAIVEIPAGMSSREMLAFYHEKGGESLIKAVEKSKRSKDRLEGRLRAKKEAA